MEEKNKLIDIFMDSKGCWTSYKDQWGVEIYGDRKTPNSYNTSWELLMPVIEKIVTLNNPNTRYASTIDVFIGQNSCSIEYNGYESGTITDQQSFISTKDAVYQAVLKFIDWYEQENN